MIFGRERRLRTTVPMGTFVVDYEPERVHPDSEVRHIKGFVVEADSATQAEARMLDYVDWVNRGLKGTRRRSLPR